MKYELEDIARNQMRIERKIDILLAVNRLYVDPETLEVSVIEEEDLKDKNSKDDDDEKEESKSNKKSAEKPQEYKNYKKHYH